MLAILKKILCNETCDLSDGVIYIEFIKSSSFNKCLYIKRHRERIRDTTKWKRNIAKLRRNERKSCVSLSTGKFRSTKLMKVGCGPFCRYKCKSNICSKYREILFLSFWKLSDNKQRHFIAYKRQV